MPRARCLPVPIPSTDHESVTHSQQQPGAFPSPDDEAVAAAVARLLEARRESVVDLAHYTRISVASLYRKLAGGQTWKAADVGRIARHFEVDPGRLFARNVVAELPPAPAIAAPAPRTDPLRSPFSHAR